MTKDTNIYEILKTQDIETIKNSAIDFSQINLASILENFYEDEVSINLEFIQFLVNNTQDINKQDEDGYTALMIAVIYGDLDTVKIFVQNGADVNIAAIDEETALTRSLDYYVKNRSFSMTEYLVDNGVDINYADKSGMSILAAVSMVLAYTYSDNAKKMDPLYIENIQNFSKVSKQDALELMEYFLKKGANPNTRVKGTNATMIPLLALMIIMHNVEAIELLLKYGATPNVVLNKNQSLLDFCVISGNLEAVKLLLKYKVDLSFTITEENPFWFLLFSKQLLKLTIPENEHEFVFEDFNKHNFEMAKLLIEHGVNADNILQNAIMTYLTDTKKEVANIENSDFSPSDKIIFTLLELNMFDVKLKTIKFLLENGANINIDYKEPTMHPLYLAVKKENLPLVKLLVQYVDDVNIYKDHNKTFSLFFDALKYRNYEIIEALIKHGANINEVILYITPLFYAIYNNDMKLVQMLIENGADVNQNVKSYKTMSPLLYAVKFNYIEIAKLLIENGANINYKFIFNFEDDFVSPISVYEIANAHDDQVLANYLEIKGADVTFPTKREEDDIDVFNFMCKSWEKFCKFFTKSKNTRAMNEEKLLEDNKEQSEIRKEIDESLKQLKEEGLHIKKTKLENLKKQPLNKEVIDAIESKSMDKLQKLIAAGFNLSNLNINNLFLNEFPHKFIYEVIRQSQSIDAQTEDGITALMFASKANSTELVKLLLDKGADKNIKNDAGKRAKDFTRDSELRKFIITHAVAMHNPQKLVRLLANFTIDKPIKYTTHNWDFGELKKEYGDFNAYMDAVKKQFENMKIDLQELSPNLYKKIYTFLLSKTTDENYSWCHNTPINIGWSSLDALKEWCDSGNKPASLTLKKPIYFEEDFEIIKLTKFKDVINIFKQEIEIRVDFNNLENLFANQIEVLGSNFNLDLSAAKLSRQFYTDVEKFSNVLDRIFADMGTRKEYANIEVITTELEDGSIEIKITQIDSYSSRSATELLQRAKQAGDISEINNALTNLCDWSIESSFEGENFRVNFLHSNNVKDIEVLETKPRGFTHILRFYK